MECYDYYYYKRKAFERRKKEAKRWRMAVDIYVGCFIKFWICCGILGLGGQSYHWTTDLLVYMGERKKTISVEHTIERQEKTKRLAKRFR